MLKLCSFGRNLFSQFGEVGVDDGLVLQSQVSFLLISECISHPATKYNASLKRNRFVVNLHIFLNVEMNCRRKLLK